MTTRDQLEIITVDGLIEFYDLDPTKGVTSIGRHPDNDIILDSPGIALFHAMLDHRQKPYHFLLLSHDESTSLAGRLLPANTSSPLQNWDNIQLEGYTLILVEGAGPIVTPGPPPVVAPVPPPPRPTAPTRPPTGPQPTRPSSLTPPTTRPEGRPFSSYAAPMLLPLPTPAASAPQPVISLTALPPDHIDDLIITELTGREWTIDVDRIATFQLTIVNGGDIVAMFAVSIEGLDESWVTISQPQVNLNEGERATVTIALTAPRLPTSRAGTHHLAIVVTSPNYPSRYSQRGATLIINPYYDFAVGELSPKQQTISWFKRFGQVTVFIANKGNSNAPFRLDGADNERACSFEFQVPGETVGLAQQAELRLPSEESIAIPVRVTPLTRRLISLRKRTYAFTITTTMIEGQQTPRSLLGQLSQKALIGPWILALMAFIFLALLAYIFRPQTREFTINNQVNPVVIEAGTPVKLSWSASFLSNVSVECKTATDCPLAGRVPGPAATMMAEPTGDAVYVLRARNLLSEIPMVGPAWFQPSLESPPVFVTPVKPLIRLFTVDDEDRAILTGQSVNLSWEVLNADEVTLQTNNAPEKLRSDQFTSQRAVSPAGETTYTLVASNRYGNDTQSITLKVNVPTPTPIPTPFVKKFVVNPSIIVVGTPVMVEWEVEGADTVSVQPIGGNLPPLQNLSQSPQENTTYVLNAARGPSAIQPIAIQVFVTPAPPEPGAPEIVFFDADPVQLIQGKATPSDDEKELTLKWLVRGDVTNIEINGGPDIGIFSNLNPEGSLPVTVNKNTVFVLTAFNQDKTSNKTAQVEILQATATPTAPPPPPPPPTPVPKPIISFFKADSAPGGSPTDVTFNGGSPPTYLVVASKNVQLSWEVKNADKVTLVGQGDQPSQGDKILPSVKTNGTFQLKATNAGGDTDAFLKLEVIAPPPPPQPFDINGIEGAGVITVTWRYDPNAKDRIEGFRVYDAESPGQALVDEFTLGRNALSWTNTSIKPGCNSYHVTAVYIDVITGNRQEVPGTNIWRSSSCP